MAMETAPNFDQFTQFLRGDSTSVYAPLNKEKNEVRRIMLFGHKQRASDIECSMETHSLDTLEDEGVVAYTALSYAWGDPNDTQGIWIKNYSGKNTWQVFHVTRNLYEFLRHIRRKRLSVWLWADQICINQRDEEEKSSQIRLMGKIYRTAYSVSCWLGEADVTTHLAIEVLQVIKAGPEQYHRITNKHLHAMVHLLRRPYWKRLWVAQEIILARSVSLACGKYVISFYDIVATYEAFITFNMPVTLERQKRAINLERFDPWLAEYVPGRLSYCVANFLRTPIHQCAQDLPIALDSLRNLDSSNPRDKIYAVIGIYDQLATTLRVDYSATLREVYTWAAFDIMQETQSLELLTFATIPRVQQQHFEMPTWVPDWRAPEEGPRGKGWRMATDGYQLSIAGVRVHESKLFNASGMLAVNIELVDGFTLRSDAIFIDRVSALCALSCTFDDQPSHASSPEWQNSIKKWVRSLHLDRDPVVPECTDPFVPLLSTISRDIQEEHGKFARMTPETHTRFSMQSLLKSGELDDNATIWSEQDWRKGHSNRLYSSMVNVRLCRFSKGYVGQVPTNAECGDVLYILGGARLPYLLREVESNNVVGDRTQHRHAKYSLIGPCFVYGLMDGEAVTVEAAKESIILI